MKLETVSDFVFLTRTFSNYSHYLVKKEDNVTVAIIKNAA